MSFKAVIIGLIICIAIILPAYAGSNGIIILDEEQQAAQNTQEYLIAQWDIANFTQTGGQSEFWITNYNAPDIPLTEINLRNHDTYEQIAYNYTKKTTLNGNETASIWNLFGLLNPESKLSKGEKCRITFEGNVTNLDVDYRNVRKTHWGTI